MRKQIEFLTLEEREVLPIGDQQELSHEREWLFFHRTQMMKCIDWHNFHSKQAKEMLDSVGLDATLDSHTGEVEYFDANFEDWPQKLQDRLPLLKDYCRYRIWGLTPNRADGDVIFALNRLDAIDRWMAERRDEIRELLRPGKGQYTISGHLDWDSLELPRKTINFEMIDHDLIWESARASEAGNG